MLAYKAHKDAKAPKDITRWASILTEEDEEKPRHKDQRSAWARVNAQAQQSLTSIQTYVTRITKPDINQQAFNNYTRVFEGLR